MSLWIHANRNTTVDGLHDRWARKRVLLDELCQPDDKGASADCAGYEECGGRAFWVVSEDVSRRLGGAISGFLFITYFRRSDNHVHGALLVAVPACQHLTSLLPACRTSRWYYSLASLGHLP